MSIEGAWIEGAFGESSFERLDWCAGSRLIVVDLKKVKS
jgi:hypothetical protein